MTKKLEPICEWICPYCNKIYHSSERAKGCIESHGHETDLPKDFWRSKMPFGEYLNKPTDFVDLKKEKIREDDKKHYSVPRSYWDENGNRRKRESD